MVRQAAAILATIAEPDFRGSDRRPARERVWRERLGPQSLAVRGRRLLESPARVVTASGRRDDPPGWWTT